MITCEAYASQCVVVVGLGKSGLAAARALCRSGARVLAWDDGEQARQRAVDEGLPTGDPARIDWSTVDALVLSPGIAHTFPSPHAAARLAKEAGVPIIGDAQLLATAGSAATMIGITGTNGKSTTTALIGHILHHAGRNAEVGGNLGPAICDMAMVDADGAYVLELSSYQLELCPSARFDIAVLLNVSPDHLDRHGGLAGYLQAKKNIFHNQGAGDVAVVGVDDAACRGVVSELERKSGPKVVPISATDKAPGGVYVDGAHLIDDLHGQAKTVMDVSSLIHLPGVHNGQNIAAAYATARHMKVAEKTIVEAIESFPGLAHRQEYLGTVAGVAFVNDSKATNAVAAAKALVCYDNIFWIAGGLAKDGGAAGLEPVLGAVRGAFLIGRAAPAFAGQLAPHVAVDMCGDLATASHKAFAAARAWMDKGRGKATVLLSPACASFDQFENFAVRGEAFRDIFDELEMARRVAS